MDEVINRIKEYVLVISPELEDDDFLDFVIREVVDRALLYTNRAQLVAGYERFLDGEYYSGDYYVDVTGTEQPVLPIPLEMERALARVVVGSYKTIIDNVTNTTDRITQISDNGQSISYGEGVVSYLSSKDDADIFSSIKQILDKFRIPTIVENTE